MRALVATIAALGILTFLLATLLTATVTSVLARRERSTLGVVKALGATPTQSFVALAPTLLLASQPALPVGILAGRLLGLTYVDWAASFLNIEVASRAVPFPGLAFALSGVLLVLGVITLTPLVRASRQSAHQILTDAASQGASLAGARPARIAALSRVLDAIPGTRPTSNTNTHRVYALRNLGRDPSRALTTALTLTLAGALFLTSTNVADAWLAALDREMRARGYDLEVIVRESVSGDELARRIREAPAVEMAVPLLREGATPVSEPGMRPTSAPSGRVWLVAAPEQPETASEHGSAPLLDLPLARGQWLAERRRYDVEPGDHGPTELEEPIPGSVPGVVHQQIAQWLELDVGQSFELETERMGQVTIEVVGVATELAPSMAIWVDRADLEALRWKAAKRAVDDTTTAILRDGADRAWVRLHSEALLPGPNRGTVPRAVRTEIEDRLQAAGLEVAGTVATSGLFRGFYDHILIFLRTLQLICVLVAAIGLFTLGSMIALQVLERRRELAILRSLGQTPSNQLRLLLTEALFLAGAAGILAALFSIPLSLVVGRITGELFVGSPLPLAISPLRLSDLVHCPTDRGRCSLLPARSKGSARSPGPRPVGLSAVLPCAQSWVSTTGVANGTWLRTAARTPAGELLHALSMLL